MTYPWEGAIPADDLARFRAGGYGNQVRPIEAGERPCVIVVDMTREFVDGRYPTGNSEHGRPAVEANVRLLDVARELGLPIDPRTT